MIKAMGVYSMKNLKWIFLLSILVILGTKIVIGVGNGTPFATIKDENVILNEILENSGEIIEQEKLET